MPLFWLVVKGAYNFIHSLFYSLCKELDGLGAYNHHLKNIKRAKN
jgi:hypothetical protein